LAALNGKEEKCGKEGSVARQADGKVREKGKR
jgi:hypothetical protein